MTDGPVRDMLMFAQQRLYTCASIVATPPGAAGRVAATIEEADVALLERAIDRFAADTPKLTGFVLPGGSETAARLDLARCVVRRAERRVVAQGLTDENARRVVSFLNRLSDLLFAAARASLAADGIAESRWDPGAERPAL